MWGIGEVKGVGQEDWKRGKRMLTVCNLVREP